MIVFAKGSAAAPVAGPLGLLGLLLLTEAGLPIPIPADLMMLLLGERVAAGALPLSVAVVALEVIAVVGTLGLFWAARGPGRAAITRLGPRVGLTPERQERVEGLIRRRGPAALAFGRSMPGLRTVTVVAASGTSGPLRPVIIGLLLGSTIFVQGHFFLGLALGRAAHAAFQRVGTAAIALLGLLAVVGLVVWLLRKRGSQGAQSWSEACCPACLALSLADRSDLTSRG